jgi:thiol-disulfide isomerase/thioredoxin
MARTEGRRAGPKTVAPAPTPDTPGRKGLVVLAIGGGAVVVALVVALAAGLGKESPPNVGMPANPSVAVVGESLPDLPDSGPDPAIGMAAPGLEGISFDGSPVRIADDGRPKVILFLAHWCPHCQAEVPALQSYMNETGLPEGVDLYSVATSNNPSSPNYPPSAWLNREGWTPPVLVDDAIGRAAEAFGLPGFPFYVLIASDGTVVERLSGEQGPELIAAKMAVLAET